MQLFPSSEVLTFETSCQALTNLPLFPVCNPALTGAILSRELESKKTTLASSLIQYAIGEPGTFLKSSTEILYIKSIAHLKFINHLKTLTTVD
jgi:hypothetical protein